MIGTTIKQLAVIMLCVTAMLGCSSTVVHHDQYEPAKLRPPVEPSYYGQVNRMAAEIVARGSIRSSDRVVIASIVDLDALDNTSAFGRQLAESLHAALTMQQVQVIEPRITGKLLTDVGEGEFAMSRDAEKLTQRHQITHMLVGTYQESNEGKHVNFRIVNTKSNNVDGAAYGFFLHSSSNAPMAVSINNGILERNDVKAI
ncbi:hypothetical protein DBZ36_03870 [Alginatibacterium sediminis]|uniref:FlgO domain-containing protein n=1 Tax=Alginatibacterium sediminis TaxID=2164068 RepID=A0A420EG24_9ALTE|nr:FlgO family outer membrane protein [Alginatibacterium sediminis]RKF19613.1 hypothetical protein DBZ36_03870 [Alginatibacterium sediminis]